MKADTSCEMFARPPKGQETEGWIWRLHGAMNGMRTASRDSTEFPAGVLTDVWFRNDEIGAMSFRAAVERDMSCISCRRPAHL